MAAELEGEKEGEGGDGGEGEVGRGCSGDGGAGAARVEGERAMVWGDGYGGAGCVMKRY